MTSSEDLVQRMRKQRAVWDTVPASSVALLSGMAFTLLGSIGAISQLASARVSIVRFAVVAGATGVFGAVLTWVAVRKTWLWIVGVGHRYGFGPLTLYPKALTSTPDCVERYAAAG